MKLLGVSEVAEMLGWRKQKVTTYLSRGVFPAPVHIVKATPLWTLSQIERYKKQLEHKT